MATSEPKYRVTTPGRQAWETKDQAVPSDYRMILWLLDYHGAGHTESFMSQFPEQDLAACISEMEELGFLERLQPGAPPDQSPAPDVVAVAESELPVIADALEKHGAYLSGDRLRGRAPAGKPHQAIRVLIVEDDPDQLALADLRVSMAGYAVDGVASQAAMLRHMADAGVPDLLLLDVMLPDGNGFRIVRNLRRLESFAKLPIVLLTARSNSADVIEGLRAGADGYITKPYSKRILADVVGRVLQL